MRMLQDGGLSVHTVENGGRWRRLYGLTLSRPKCWLVALFFCVRAI